MGLAIVPSGLASDKAFGSYVLGKLGDVALSYQRQWRRWQNVAQSLKLDPENLAEVAHEDAEFIRANLPLFAAVLASAGAVMFVAAECGIALEGWCKS